MHRQANPSRLIANGQPETDCGNLQDDPLWCESEPHKVTR